MTRQGVCRTSGDLLDELAGLPFAAEQVPALPRGRLSRSRRCHAAGSAGTGWGTLADGFA